MNARTTAIISTRLIGLVLLLLGAGQLLGQVIPFIAFMDWLRWNFAIILDNISVGSQFGLSPNRVVMSLVGLGLGWYLLFRGRRVHAWLIAGLGSACGKCGYDLRGVSAEKCPECGQALDRRGAPGGP